MHIRKAVIPVAGLGTRFLPATKAIPKEMFPIVDKPSIQYIVEEAVQSGIESIVFVTALGKEAIENHFDTHIEIETILKDRQQLDLLKEVKSLSQMASIVSVRQKQPLGLGHAILCAKDIIGDEPFAVLLADDLVDAKTPCLKQLINQYQKTECPVVALMEVQKEHANRYGIVKMKTDPADKRLYHIEGFVEKPPTNEAPSNLAIIGRYILTPDVFESLEKTPEGAGNEIQLTDGLSRLLAIRKILGYRYEGLRFDAGDKVGFLKAQIHYALKKASLKDEVEAHIKELV